MRKLIQQLIGPLYWWSVGRMGRDNITHHLSLPEPTDVALGKFNLYHGCKRVGYISFKGAYRLEAVKAGQYTVLIVTEREDIHE